MTKELFIKIPGEKNIAVIGAGIFGILSALHLAERGYKVTVYEKNSDILMGASYINQNRVHMGYHYPRSEETAQSSHTYQKAFERMFKEAVVDDFEHYYCIAKKDSLTSSREYLSFCDRMGLPYKKKWPKEITLNKKAISLSLLVPEKLYDANLLRKILKSMLAKDGEITLLLETEIVSIQTFPHSVIVRSKHKNIGRGKKYDAVINATYSAINKILESAHIETKKYQYELCEVPIVAVPWSKKIGCTIMDGPFWGILPFGLSKEYLLYDVELSVLERSFGRFPNFRLGVSHYDSPEVREKRFKLYINKAKKYVPEMVGSKHLYSVYVTRIILPRHDHDDARPTEVLRHNRGVWSIFSGKVSAAIPSAERIVEEMNAYFNSSAHA